MRILIRTSKWAIWARRLASFSLPLLVIPVLLHRQRLIESDTFHTMLAVALVVVVTTVLTGLVALIRLWFTGDKGWDRALVALVVGLACLAPFGWASMMAARYPQATDVATADRQRLPLLLDKATSAMSQPVRLSPSTLEIAFPNVKTRTYPLNAQQVYDVALQLIEERGWQVLARNRPATAESEGRINARVTTLLGWLDDVVVAVAGGEEGAGIDMRSVSLAASHDLGANGRRVEEYLAAFDTQVTELLRDNPNITEPIIEAPITGAPIDVPLPPPRP